MSCFGARGKAIFVNPRHPAVVRRRSLAGVAIVVVGQASLLTPPSFLICLLALVSFFTTLANFWKFVQICFSTLVNGISNISSIFHERRQSLVNSCSWVYIPYTTELDIYILHMLAQDKNGGFIQTSPPPSQQRPSCTPLAHRRGVPAHTLPKNERLPRIISLDPETRPRASRVPAAARRRESSTRVTRSGG